MHLVIRARSLTHASMSQPIVAEFDERGGTIGRSDSNTMALPDPARHVSRLQAEVRCATGVYTLCNVGNANPIIVNGRPLGHGETVPLRDQDQLAIGSYELRVELRAQEAQAPLRAVDGRTVIGASAREARTGPPRHPGGAAGPAPGDPFAGLLGLAGAADAAGPFADLLGPAWPGPAALSAPGPEPTHPGAAVFPPAPAPTPWPSSLLSPSSPSSPSPSPSPSSPSSSPAPPSLPDDFDPFADLAAPAPALAVRGGPQAPLRDLLGPGAAAPGIDTLFGLDTARPGQPDALDAFLRPPPAPQAPSTTDPFASLGLGGPPREPVGPAAGDDTSDLQAAYTPPPVVPAAPLWWPPPAQAATPVWQPPAAASPSPSPSPPAPPWQPPSARAGASEAPADGDADALWNAFCEGAGLSLPARPGLTPELMRLLGGTLRHAVEGTLQLNAMRTVIKQEMHVPVTTIKSRGNNPLKFAPDAVAALTQLVQPPLRGFMAAPEAMRDAMDDLLGHAAGTMEGTRAALKGMLARFEPAQLEAQLAPGGLLDRLMPGHRRARLWELYLQHFDRIGESAREEFDELFGRAFTRAYEEQAARVAAVRRDEAAG